jgi:glucose-1-phosphate thymidylyltransferase
VTPAAGAYEPPPVGLVPAAGFARRLGDLPGSKEVLPLAWPEGRPLVAVDRLLAQMGRAGIATAVVVLRQGKWDVPGFLGRGRHGVEVVYRVVEPTGSIPETLAAALPWIAERRVALGFPDLLCRPADALARLVEHQGTTGADAALALLPTPRADKSDMAETDGEGRLLRLWIKQGRSDLALSWAFAVWGPRFTELLAERAGSAGPEGRELYPGDLFNEAVARGLTVATLSFPDGALLDVGTPDDLARVGDGHW